MFLTAKFLCRIQNFGKRALRFLLGDYGSTNEQLLNKAGRISMSINRLRTLYGEICKTLNKLNPSFMKNISTVKET